MTDAAAPPAPARRAIPDGMVLAIACVAQFMVVLDVSIVNVALPSIGRELHYTPTGLQWVVNAYVLTFAGFLLLGGRAADLFGRRKAYLFGLTLFTVASVAGGFAQGTAWLTAARALQGIGGAFLSPATLTIIVTTFQGKRLAKALGTWSAVAGGGGALGVVLGGVLTAGLSWRWVLFVNLPIGIVAAVAALAYLTEARRSGGPRQRLDVGGAVTVTAGLGALVYAIVGTDTHPWGSAHTLGLIGAAVVLLAVFAVVQMRVASAPLVPFRLFRSRSVSGANVVMLLVGAAFFGMWYFLSLYLQGVLHFGALTAGVAFLPMSLVIVIGAQTASRLLARYGARPLLVAGTALGTGGFVLLAQVDGHADYASHVLVGGCVVSLALGLLFTPLAAAATAGVARHEAGLASGVLNTSRQVGGSLGLAVLATIATDRTVAAHRAGQAAGAALTAGYDRAFVVAAVLTALALVACAGVPGRGRSAAAERGAGGTVGAGSGAARDSSAGRAASSVGDGEAEGVPVAVELG